MALTNPNTPVSEQDLHDFYNRIKPYLGGGGGGGSLPAGGTTGQSLVKHSDSDNDAEWFDVNKEISFDDFNELTQEEKDNGTSYYIPDATVVSNLTVMGNRFDKANIYTDTERIIGSFLGKPLYQKTITGLKFAESITDGTNTRKYYFLGENFGITNIENIIYCCGSYLKNCIPTVWINTNTYIRRINFADAENDMYIITESNRSTDSDQAIDNVTIQYTKTTDTTVNIGTGNDYSTDEQIIGTWIDGKPLYQKTIDFGALPNNTTKNIAHGITNLGKVVLISGYSYDGTNFSCLPQVNDSQINSQMLLLANSTNVSIRTTSNRSSWTETYVTLQYTKTTD